MLKACDCVICREPNRVVNSHDLVKLGTHNPDGSLTKEYGGDRHAD